MQQLIEIQAKNVSKCVHVNPDHISSIEVYEDGSYLVKMANGDTYVTNVHVLSTIQRQAQHPEDD